MDTVRVISSLSQALTPSAVALGNFDGLHRGHCKVISALREFSAAQPAHLTVVAFDPHPQAFFSGQPQLLLTPLAEKVTLLEDLGVEQLVLLKFDQALAQLSPQEFVDQILVQQLEARSISVGFNFGFGRQRSGTTADLDAIASHYQIPVHIATPQTAAAQPISSSAIRTALLNGQLDPAHHMLGRPYTLTGKVVEGQHLGATLGFPTANLKLPDDKFLPRHVAIFRTRHSDAPKPVIGRHRSVKTRTDGSSSANTNRMWSGPVLMWSTPSVTLDVTLPHWPRAPRSTD